jgi:hypothetical protein
VPIGSKRTHSVMWYAWFSSCRAVSFTCCLMLPGAGVPYASIVPDRGLASAWKEHSLGTGSFKAVPCTKYLTKSPWAGSKAPCSPGWKPKTIRQLPCSLP